MTATRERPDERGGRQDAAAGHAKPNPSCPSIKCPPAGPTPATVVASGALCPSAMQACWNLTAATLS
jgi:hypothetical protein